MTRHSVQTLLCPGKDRPAHGCREKLKTWGAHRTHAPLLPTHCSTFFPLNEPTLTKRRKLDFLFTRIFFWAVRFSLSRVNEHSEVWEFSARPHNSVLSLFSSSGIPSVRNSFLCGQHCEAVKLDQILAEDKSHLHPLLIGLIPDHFWAHFLICETYWLFKKVPLFKSCLKFLF